MFFIERACTKANDIQCCVGDGFSVRLQSWVQQPVVVVWTGKEGERVGIMIGETPAHLGHSVNLLPPPRAPSGTWVCFLRTPTYTLTLSVSRFPSARGHSRTKNHLPHGWEGSGKDNGGGLWCCGHAVWCLPPTPKTARKHQNAHKVDGETGIAKREVDENIFGFDYRVIKNMEHLELSLRW